MPPCHIIPMTFVYFHSPCCKNLSWFRATFNHYLLHSFNSLLDTTCTSSCKGNEGEGLHWCHKRRSSQKTGLVTQERMSNSTNLGAGRMPSEQVGTSTGSQETQSLVPASRVSDRKHQIICPLGADARHLLQYPVTQFSWHSFLQSHKAMPDHFR